LGSYRSADSEAYRMFSSRLLQGDGLLLERQQCRWW